LFASRLLSWLAVQPRWRPVLVLGDGAGAWRHRFAAADVTIAADALDEWWGGRLRGRFSGRRGQGQLRAVRAAWWRLRLRRARLVAASGPLPAEVAAHLPAWMRTRAAEPTLPEVLPPDLVVQGAAVAGGSNAGAHGIDLWLRAAHHLVGADGAPPLVWIETEAGQQPTHAVDHEIWHLGLDEHLELRPADPEATPLEVADASVLVLPARPGADPLAPLGDHVPTAEWLVRTGQVPVVRFADDEHVLPGAGPEVEVGVAYPDVVALADAVRAATPVPRDEVERRLEVLLAGAGR
jgi:hypothetical protein